VAIQVDTEDIETTRGEKVRRVALSLLAF